MKGFRRIRLPLLLLLPLSACHGPQSTLHPAGPAASNLSQIGWAIYILFSAVAVIVLALLVYAFVRRHGSLEEHERWNAGGGQKAVLVGGLLIPLAILFGVFVFSLKRTSEFPIRDGGVPHPQILVIGHQWWWEVHYIGGPPDTQFVTANEIHIPVGRPVDLELLSADVIHSFWVPALHGKMDLIPGQVNFLRIEAAHAGSFPGQCAVFCGEQHAHMRLVVVAQPLDQYRAWYKDQLQPASKPTGAVAVHGEQVFDDAACALCHTIRGTAAEGKVAPDLTHLASRQYIGADSFRNNMGNLAGWVTHAQALKPGCLMPNLTVFNGTDLRALVTYLNQLK
jgi:cytochrome c oxidase subunit 2